MVAEAVVASFILCLSGVSAQTQTCAVKGSSVHLSCLAETSTSGSKWYVMHSGQAARAREVVAAEGRVTFASDGNQSTLTINDVRESDANLYCCAERPNMCQQKAIQLSVTDLQVMVFPATMRQTVSLMCSTSCRPTETPLVYIWYRNGQFLYDDWSPWYQELVGSDTAATYSCAMKGYEDLRAPDVSVDSVTSACFSVTYAKGRMCLGNEDESCSVTFPRDTRVEGTAMSNLSCASSCARPETQTDLVWYINRCANVDLPTNTSNASISCAFKGVEHLPSNEVCVEDENCWTVNYANRRICAAEGSSVNIVSDYSHPDDQEPRSKLWYKSSGGQAAEPLEAGRHAEYQDKTTQHILRINNLRESDSAEYTFRLQEACKGPELPGVTLTVTGLKVRLNPEVATEGERVVLSCGTSCPLQGVTAHVWYMNGRLLTHSLKHLVLESVSSGDAGNYSCVARTSKRNISSTETMLMVTSAAESPTLAAAAGASAALLLITTLSVIWWMRKKTCSWPPAPEEPPSAHQLNSGPLYENISAPPTRQDDHHYQGLVFSAGHTDDLYSTMNCSEGGQSC